ncbi:MAG: SDR family oxidoreductase [Ignavibacteriales bacterium]|nr:SDR family oxidoreductase [Ignavibacteriales bacterium]
MNTKTVLITGASKGLGEQLAKIFSKNNYNIIIHGRDIKRLEALQEAVLKEGVECFIAAGDLKSIKTIYSLAETAEAKNIDILINNAAVYLKKSLTETSFEDYRNVIESNLLAPIFLIKQLFPFFERKGEGAIININSFAGKNGSDGESAYCASKHGLRGFTNSIQYDAVRAGIRIIDVYLGAMNTDMVNGRKDKEKCISTVEAADFIFKLCSDYKSMRVNEIDLARRIY